MKFKDWFNENYDDMLQWYKGIEPELLKNPTIQQELKTNGLVSLKTIQALGYGDGSPLIQREFNKAHGNDQVYYAKQNAQAAAEKAAETDEYYYHVALKTNWTSIKKNGLVPNAPATMTNYQDYSKGKIFLSDKVSVPYWKSRVEDHETAISDNPKGTIVLRVKKTDVPNVEADQLGTTDSRKPSYFTRQAIPAKAIEVVK